MGEVRDAVAGDGAEEGARRAGVVRRGGRRASGQAYQHAMSAAETAPGREGGRCAGGVFGVDGSPVVKKFDRRDLRLPSVRWAGHR